MGNQKYLIRRPVPAPETAGSYRYISIQATPGPACRCVSVRPGFFCSFRGRSSGKTDIIFGKDRKETESTDRAFRAEPAATKKKEKCWLFVQCVLLNGMI